jgi:prepilin-type N-terminal cleavage/methylation domain-containing protein
MSARHVHIRHGMGARGFTLMEVLVALGILCVAALGGIQLVAVATETMARARVQATAASLAAARLEQLRALRFEFDATGLRVTDQSTNVAEDPPVPGGPGLAVSGGSTLETSVSGYVDYLDRNGRWLGAGTRAPSQTAFVRRWAIEAVDASGDLLALQVLVRPVASGEPSGNDRAAGEVRLVTLRARLLR